MKMKTIDTKPFKEMQIDVWSSLMGMEEREIAEVYGKYLLLRSYRPFKI